MMAFSLPIQVLSRAFLILASVASHGAQPSVDVQVTDAWIRWLPANLPSAGYMTLANKGAVEQTLVSASSPDFGEVTLHRSGKASGMSGMVPVESIKLPPNVSVNFAAEGYHLMLMQPRHSLGADERISVILRFASGQSLTIAYAVRAANPSAR